jgi:hypothetical protein
MASSPVTITTTASIRDAVGLFEKSMRVSWFSENISGAGTTFEPPRTSAYPDDPPQYATMALLGGRGAEIQKSAVHMYAWDRGDHREIQMAVGKNLGALGMKAKGKMRKYVAALQTIDPSLSTTGL